MYESSIVQNMAALIGITFEESLCEVLRGLNLENVSLRVQQKEAISIIVVLNKDTLIISPKAHATSAVFTSGLRFYCSQANQSMKKKLSFLCLQSPSFSRAKAQERED